MESHVQAWFVLKVDDEIRAKIRDWIRDEKDFDPKKVKLGKSEILVKVMKECCSATSSGVACD
jgi:hypothetical protein